MNATQTTIKHITYTSPILTRHKKTQNAVTARGEKLVCRRVLRILLNIPRGTTRRFKVEVSTCQKKDAKRIYLTYAHDCCKDLQLLWCQRSRQVPMHFYLEAEERLEKAFKTVLKLDEPLAVYVSAKYVR